MSKRTRSKVVAARYFSWIVKRRGEMFYADGRGSHRGLGRYSLGTRDPNEALQRLAQLDGVKAVELGLADASVLRHSDANSISLEASVTEYLEFLSRPVVAGGASRKTLQRYQAVFDKFLPFARNRGIDELRGVTEPLLTAYLAHLQRKKYADRTIYLEGSLIKQFIKRAIRIKHLPTESAITLPLRKVLGTTTYCWSPEEFQAMLTHCSDTRGLKWLGSVLKVLGYSGVRISEAAALRWSDVDFDKNVMHITNDPDTRKGNLPRRLTKNRRDRCFPIHPELRAALQRIPRTSDGRVLRGPLGGVLKPDTVRNILTKQVLRPLKSRFPAAPGESSFRDGRLHSFRHFYCSRCANQGVAERLLMHWLGHSSSEMIRVYYHANDAEAQRQMMTVSFAGAPGGDVAVG